MESLVAAPTNGSLKQLIVCWTPRSTEFASKKQREALSAKATETVAVIGIPIHPYFGPIYLWHSPKFPMADVMINGMPACTVGAMGYFVHIPQGIPIPPTPTNISYWTRYLTNIRELTRIISQS